MTIDLHEAFQKVSLRLNDGASLEPQLDEFPEPVRRRLQQEFYDNGPLETLLEDSTITEIVVNGPNDIYFERAGVFTRHPEGFLSELSFNNFIHRLSQKAQIVTNLNTPCADGVWRHFRVHLVGAPLTPRTCLTLRRHPENPWTFAKLAETGWIGAEPIQVVKNFIQQRKNILIIGPTGSGKTSVLNACLHELPADERVISIEDTDEIKSPNAVSTKLLTRRDINGYLREYNQQDLVFQSLRMRPQRLVMGEIRGGEAKDYLMALATGHRGALATLHAESPWQALLRLEMLIQLGAPQWGLSAIRNLIRLSLDGILVTAQVGGQRRLTGLYTIASLEETGFLLERVI